KMQTLQLPGIYAAGQHVRQISNAVGDATSAAVAATRYIEALDAGQARQEPAACSRANDPQLSVCARERRPRACGIRICHTQGLFGSLTHLGRWLRISCPDD